MVSQYRKRTVYIVKPDGVKYRSHRCTQVTDDMTSPVPMYDTESSQRPCV